ncbi:MAG: MarC family protein [Acidobacteriota bacterium]|jgi:multiple antibiotic resistance protein|nr:MarC family protein [Acidobacteriota bacterium]
MELGFIQTASAFIVLFAIIDILGSIPVILNLQRKSGKLHALKTSVVSLAILVLFLFGGEYVLHLFGVDIESFAVAGALVIFMYAVEMILDVEIFRNKGPAGASSIVPLAFPLIAGPGSFTTLLSLRAEYALENILAALVLNMAIVYAVLKGLERIEKTLGEGAIYIMRKFFGIILLAIAVKLFTTNVGSMMAGFFDCGE